jgi:ribonuclease HI
MATGKHCSNFKTETEALMKAVSMIIDSSEAVFSVVFLTDARSVLEALINNKSPDLARTMNELSTISNVIIQWIPAHCGITGNKEAGQLAKFGAQS